MSPTKRVGESDPNRGTAPEAITAGRYKGHVAIVTGAGSGIGRATARRLAAEGAAVACLDLAEDAIGAVVKEINEEAADAGGRARHTALRSRRFAPRSSSASDQNQTCSAMSAIRSTSFVSGGPQRCLALPDLPHHRAHIGEVPDLGELAVFDAIKSELPNSHPTTGT